MTSFNLRRTALGAGVVALSVAGLAGLASSALFTATDTTSTDKYTTGTVVLSTDGTASALDLGNMAPGDSASREFVVTNTGSLAYRYAISSDSTGKLLASTTKATLRSGSCEKPGESIYDGALYGLAVGSKATGADEGDRALAANSAETLCLTVSIDAGTGNELQGKSNATTVTFDAEQTANN